MNTDRYLLFLENNIIAVFPKEAVIVPQKKENEKSYLG